MQLKATNKQVIDEVPFGVYVWKLPDGEFLGDDEGNFLLIQAMRGDEKRINTLRQAAKYYGHEEGEPVFWSGKRPISDEEYENQIARAKAGLTPDPLDIGAIKEEERLLKQGYDGIGRR